MTEKTGFKDRVILVCRRKDNSVKWRYDSKEDAESGTISKFGMAQVAGLVLTDVGGTAFDYIAIGTGVTPSTKDDADIEALVKRKAATGTQVTTTETDDTAQLVALFSKALDGLTGTDNITEATVDTALGHAVILFRIVFGAKTVDWDANETLEVTAQCQMKQGA